MHSHAKPNGGNNILVAFFLNAGFAVVEFIGGYLTNSMAIYSDALHDLGDSMALLFAYVAEKLSVRKEDSRYTFGYRRFSVLSAAVNGIILLLGSLYVIYEAIQRIFNPEPVEAGGMLVLAVFGVIVNSYAAFRLSKSDGLNPKMVMLHLLEDVLGWVAVFIVSVILLFKPWYVLDSVLSILVALIILRGVYKNLLKVGYIFLQKFPDGIELDQIKQEIESLEPVESVHAFKGWSIDESNYYLRFHVLVPGEMTINKVDLLRERIKLLLKAHAVSYSTIEFEGSSCSD